MSEQSDPELVYLALRGDKTAFDRLVLRYQPMAQHIANRTIGNEDLAQELVQDAMLQAYLSLKNLRDPECFRSWLYGIVLNVCRSNLRRRKVILFSLETAIADFGNVLSIDGSSSDPQQVVEQQERYTVLLKAIDTLSDRNRLAILLFYQEQLSLKEVAERLDISVSAVKGRLHKSRHQLKEKLQPLQDRIQSTSLQEQTVTTKTDPQLEIKLCCSFCEKNREQVKLLIAGPGVYICDECVNICNQIISRETLPKLTQEEVESSIDSSKLDNQN